MGDRVRLTGDLSGRPDTLARIVAVEERSSVLRRSLEDAPDQRGEKAIVANADTMCIVVALADPPPRTGMIDRCLVAAFEAGLDPVLVLTKADLASADELIAAYQDFDVRVVLTSAEAGAAWVLPWPPSPTRQAHMASKVGSVLEVHAMSSTVMPGVRRPRIAPKVAMR